MYLSNCLGVCVKVILDVGVCTYTEAFRMQWYYASLTRDFIVPVHDIGLIVGDFLSGYNTSWVGGGGCRSCCAIKASAIDGTLSSLSRAVVGDVVDLTVIVEAKVEWMIMVDPVEDIGKEEIDLAHVIAPTGMIVTGARETGLQELATATTIQVESQNRLLVYLHTQYHALLSNFVL
ncbi:hypothetical protein X801_06132 [Opisthorchis viverrini]|uniref:Uncharacterized protein n=1 Tax=Opisthorchis viverrini TaxID=6198 RepID=A0A1S8WU21_OPIVI|nr:hypothetical protein X801_06132 [Opisthorchis viverrini]